MKKSLLALLVSVALAVPVFAATGNAAKNVSAETVGGFAVKLAAALGAQASDQQTAIVALKAAGVNLRADLGAKLTESEAARILSDLGMKVASPTNPADEVSSAKATQLATAAGMTVLTKPIATEGDDLPIYCLSEKNNGQCVNCCKLAQGYDPSLPAAGQITKGCTQFCKYYEPTCPSPPCDPEPTP